MKPTKTGDRKLGRDLRGGDRVYFPAAEPCDDYPDGLREEYAIVCGDPDEGLADGEDTLICEGLEPYGASRRDRLADFPVDADQSYELWDWR